MFKTEPNNYAHYRRLGERETDLHIMKEQINTRRYKGQYHYQHTKIVTLKTQIHWRCCYNYITVFYL